MILGNRFSSALVHILYTILIFGLFAGAAPAQEPPAAAPPLQKDMKPPAAPVVPAASGDQKVILNFGDQVDIKLIVDYVAARTKTNYIYDETLTGTVSLRAPKEVSVTALQSILESILEFKGWALSPSPEGFVKVVSASVAGTKPTPFYGPNETAKLPDRDVIVTQVVALKNTDAATVMNSLQGIMSGVAAPRAAQPGRPAAGGAGLAAGSRIFAVPGQRMLVLTDYAPNVARMLKMIEVLDVTADQPPLKLIPLKYIRADEYAPKITAYLRARSGMDSSAQGRAGFAIDSDARLNALVVVALPADMEAIASLAEQLDVPVPEAERPYRIIRLKNTKAEDMLATVQQIMGGGMETTTASGHPSTSTPAPSGTTPRATTGTPAYAAAAPATAAAATDSSAAIAAAGGGTMTGLVGSQVQAIANKHTNSLILVGPPREQALLAAIIEQLDMRRPQVMIEALVVEVSRSQALDIGVELLNLQRGAVRGGTNFGLSKIDFAAKTAAVSASSGLTGFVIKGGDIQAIVKLMEQKGNGRIVSRPRALVNDNEAASFVSEAEEPYTQINAVGSNTTTSSFGGYETAGTYLDVTPHISEADYLQLDIHVKLSAFTGTAASDSAPPARHTDEVTSKVTIPDNSTVLIGGLNRADNSNSRSQVPILGSIPLLGQLFRRDTSDASQATLYVFIKTRIARAEDFSDLKGLSSAASRQVITEENLTRPEYKQLPVKQDLFESPAASGAGIHEP